MVAYGGGFIGFLKRRGGDELPYIKSLREFVNEDVLDDRSRLIGKFSKLLKDANTGRIIGIQLDNGVRIQVDANRILFVYELRDDGSIMRYVRVLPKKDEGGGRGEYDDIKGKVDRLLCELDEVLSNLVNLDKMLLSNSISEVTFSQVRDDFERRKRLLIEQCKDLLSDIEDRLNRLERRVNELQSQKGGLLLKLTLGDQEARRRLESIEVELAELTKAKAELIALKSALEAVCLLK